MCGEAWDEETARLRAEVTAEEGTAEEHEDAEHAEEHEDAEEREDAERASARKATVDGLAPATPCARGTRGGGDGRVFERRFVWR